MASAGKTGIKKSGPSRQSDTNVKAMTMGSGWSTRAMRKGSASRGASGGKATRRELKPPADGWKGG